MISYKKPAKSDIFYFSGTGGTALAAKRLATSLEQYSIKCNLQEIHQNSVALREDTDLLVLLFPVYAMNAPTPVITFLKKLTPCEGIPVAVLSVSGGGDVFPNTACRVQCNKMLQKKGYLVVYEKMLVMPSNFAAKTPDIMSKHLLRVLPIKIEKIATDLLSGTVCRAKPKNLDRVIDFCARVERYGAKLWGKHIHANENCNGCGLCAKNCPTGNITMLNGKPVYARQCTLCLKCIYHCPQKALEPRFGKFIIIKDGYRLAEFEKEAKSLSPALAEELPDSVAMSAVKKYILDADKG